MNDNNISQLHKPEPTDLLQQVLKKGAQQLLAQAIEAEVQQLLADHKGLLTEDGKTGLNQGVRVLDSLKTLKTYDPLHDYHDIFLFSLLSFV